MPGNVDNTYIDNPAWQASFLPAQAPQHNAVYIWHGITPHLLHLYPNYYALLSAGEQVKANRYFQAAHRQRYVIQHGLLRLLLGWYLKLPVFTDAFIYGDGGKPYLPETDAQSCFFNLSNSAGEFIIAIGDRELGVDIEQLKAGFNYRDIITHYFGADEQHYIANAPNPVKAFFLLWTRKEALLKATGKGIDDSLPTVPALNGKHILPDNYNDTDWLTGSFKAGDNSMISVTYQMCQMSLQLMYLE